MTTRTVPTRTALRPTTRGRRRLGAALVAVATLVAACGSDDDDTTGSDETTAEGVTTPADDTATTDPSVTEAPGTDPSGTAPSEGAEPDAPAPTAGGTITVGVEAEPTGWNPLTDPCNEACSTVRFAIFDPLVEFDAEGIPQPYVAESVTPNDDASEWTVTIRDGVTFHDGTPVTGATIVGMYDLLRAPEALTAGRYANITDVVLNDDDSVTFVLNGSSSGFPDLLNTFVFDPEAASTDPAGYSENPVGTGPFVFGSWDRGAELTVVRNDAYWRTTADGTALPYLDGITFRFIPDEDARLASLQAGDIDVLQTLRESTVRQAAEVDGVVVEEFQGNQSTGGMYNTALAPYDDVRVRRGLNALLDQEGLIDVLGGTGISEPATQYFAPTSPYWSQSAADAYLISDTDAGAELLQEYIDDPARSDGKSPGEPIEVSFNCLPDPSLTELSQAIQAMWEQTGQVQVSLNSLESAAHIDAVIGAPPDFTGTFGAACWRHSSQADPSASAVNYAPSEGNPSNYTNMVDDEIVELFAAADAETDPDARVGLYQQIWTKVNELGLEFYLGHTVSAIVRAEAVGPLDTWTLPDGSPGYGHPQAVARWHEATVTG